MRWPASARERTRLTAANALSSSENQCGSRSMRPASTLDRSSTSLMRASSWRPAPRMSSTYPTWRSFRSPKCWAPSTSANPMTALSGVRSSCDMLARNSVLWRLASSMSRRWCSASTRESSAARRATAAARDDSARRPTRASTVAAPTEQIPTRNNQRTTGDGAGCCTDSNHAWATPMSTSSTKEPRRSRNMTSAIAVRIRNISL